MLAVLPVMRPPRDINGRGGGLAKGLSGEPVPGGETPIQPYGADVAKTSPAFRKKGVGRKSL
jgi:hypothetical protein